MVDTVPEWTEKQRFDTFWTRLFEEALGTGNFQWDKFDLVSDSVLMYLIFRHNPYSRSLVMYHFIVQLFFPICGTTHQYVVCFDLPDGKMNIIDHSLAEPHGSFVEKYGNTISLLVRKRVYIYIALC